MTKLVVCLGVLVPLFAATSPTAAAQQSETISESTVQVQWTTEPMNAPSPERLNEVQFGARDSVGVSNGEPQNRRFTSLRILALGKPVAVQAWMYMDLANPSDSPYIAYGNKNGISIRFRVGAEGNAWDVVFRLLPQSSGYKVTERQACLAEMKPDVCIVTYNSMWQSE